MVVLVMILASNLLGEEKPMLSPINAVPPSSDSINKGCTFVCIEALDRPASFPYGVGM